MAHTLDKTFQRKSNCSKHSEGYQMGCMLFHENAQPLANNTDFSVTLTINDKINDLMRQWLLGCPVAIISDETVSTKFLLV